MSEFSTSSPVWHVARYPFLGWLETAIKLVAIAIGIVAGVQALQTGVFTWPTGLQLIQTGIIALIAMGLIGTIVDRYLDREVIAMVFVFLWMAGHVGMLIGLLYRPWPGLALIAFSLLMALGDVVKLRFFVVHNFKVRDIPRRVMFVMTGLMIACYLVILSIEWIT